MNEIEVINVLKRYSNKKTEKETERDKITIAFIQCCDLVIFRTFLAWSKLCVKQNIKHLEMDKYMIITFPLQRHLAFLKDFVFRVYFILFGYYMHLSKFTWK